MEWNDGSNVEYPIWGLGDWSDAEEPEDEEDINEDSDDEE